MPTPDFGRLDTALAAGNHEGYLLDADGATADQRYLSGYDAPDPYFTLYTPDSLELLVSELEYTRAKNSSAADTVRRYSDYEYADLRAEHGERTARRRMLAAFLDDRNVASVLVPHRFPLDTADGLRAQDITVETTETDLVTEIRAVKTATEIEHISTTQRANEAAMATAEALLTQAEIVDDTLHRNGEPLTAEYVKQRIEHTLLDHGCGLDETIVAGGEQGADPHERGHGPLPADEPIVIDIFPQDKTTKYHADMTRTFVRGSPSQAATERYEITEQALDAALAAIEPGITGAEVHNIACDVYEDAGYPTLREDPAADTGFIHSTGHGVGLDVHELPRLNPAGQELKPGHVVTVEPGLYDPSDGGIRIEDFVVVTETGHENFTEYPREFAVN